MDPFFQQPPEAGNRFHTDPTLRLALQWRLPDEVFRAAAPHLEQLGELAATVMPPLAERAEHNPPRHIAFDPWGRRVDRIEVDDSWLALMHLGQRQGLVALPYEDPYDVHTRVVQAGLINLYDPASAVADCPLVMTDGAATLLNEHDPALARRYVPRLTARENAWTSGQWMTERSGGSDVGRTETRAVPAGDGEWRLHGSKWFTSATTSDMALALARPENAQAGSRGLSLFLLELRDQDGGWNGIQVRRLKDKFGTRALPTAELDLVGTRAVPAGGARRPGRRRGAGPHRGGPGITGADDQHAPRGSGAASRLGHGPHLPGAIAGGIRTVAMAMLSGRRRNHRRPAVRPSGAGGPGLRGNPGGVTGGGVRQRAVDVSGAFPGGPARSPAGPPAPC